MNTDSGKEMLLISPIAELCIAIGIVRNNPRLIFMGEIERERFAMNINNFKYGCGI